MILVSRKIFNEISTIIKLIIAYNEKEINEKNEINLFMFKIKINRKKRKERK